MFPVPRNISLKTLKSMQQEIYDYMPKDIQLTQLGQKLYRYAPWQTKLAQIKCIEYT